MNVLVWRITLATFFRVRISVTVVILSNKKALFAPFCVKQFILGNTIYNKLLYSNFTKLTKVSVEANMNEIADPQEDEGRPGFV